ncbi:ATP-dependent DNA helicase DinG [Gallaecimonas kandeliae]|uniref:ATP-dependent DNA helicase DinG n=1 Tax=Gallaecimonas kandeliae TaxID=3029055 RepID=UPI0026487C5A|nr:ATP-dependent DNA helicase DinG [Gallaecimonas kandeliae]WKE64455.1 ATP-dependent DNA helicase DinG [Gallaecimonas kandeliae]
MLSEKIKNEIKHFYRQLGEQSAQFRPRKGQQLLVAEVAKTLGGDYHRQQRLLMAEAGTGVGKSLGYLLGALPVARHHKRKVVVATATVALQEQLIKKDIHQLVRAGLKVEARLLKGRQRYCCLHKLKAAASEADLFGQASFYQKLLDTYLKGKWDGDRDSWPQAIAPERWHGIESDRLGCSGKHHIQCPYWQVRDKAEQVDLWVVNHHVLLSDLAQGGGTLLPAPDDCFYIIDEAHHLAESARTFMEEHSRLLADKEWLTKLPGWLDELQGLMKRDGLVGPAMAAQELALELAGGQQGVYQWLGRQPFAQEANYRFPEGKLPDWLKNVAEDQHAAAQKLNGKLQQLLSQLDGDIAPKLLPLQEHLLTAMEGAERLQKLWGALAAEQTVPWAKWLERSDKDITLSAAPIEVASQLRHKLWEPCAGAVLVSATLRSHQGFTHAARELGLNHFEGCQYRALPSPFDYPAQARLVIPKMQAEPADPHFTDELARVLPDWLPADQASLVLFASYWQMEAVLEKVAKRLPHPPLVQGRENRQAMLEAHALRVKNGQGSILFGTGALAEGLDLKGELLTNLIITKLPFAVPDDPVSQAQAEYIEKKGGNAFSTLALPQVARRLVQAAGRLLRSESDYGRIVLLDRRLVSRRYGRQLLDALPPFTREIHK